MRLGGPTRDEESARQASLRQRAIEEHFTHQQRSTIANACRVALEAFRGDVKTLREVAAAIRRGETSPMFAEGEPGAKAVDRLAEQFERQIKETEDIYLMFEE